MSSSNEFSLCYLNDVNNNIIRLHTLPGFDKIWRLSHLETLDIIFPDTAENGILFEQSMWKICLRL